MKKNAKNRGRFSGHLSVSRSSGYDKSVQRTVLKTYKIRISFTGDIGNFSRLTWTWLRFEIWQIYRHTRIPEYYICHCFYTGWI